jgi:hypothetical protein
MQEESVFLRHPVRMGMLLSLISLLVALLAIFIPTFFLRGGGDLGLILGLILGGIRWILFVCTDIQAHAVAASPKSGCRYAAAWLLLSAVLIGALGIYLANGNVSALEPHADWFAGLGYIVYFFYILIVYAAEILTAVITMSVYALRERNKIQRKNHCSEE